MAMDVVATAKLIQSGDAVAIVLLLALAAPVIVKGVFALNTGRHQRRKEFLELWKEVGLRDDTLWLEEVFKHRYRAELPAPLIKHVLALTHPSAKLRRLAMVSDFLKLDATRSLVAWTKPRRARLRWFLLEYMVLHLAYFVLALAGVLLIVHGWKVWSITTVVLSFSGLLLLGMAFVAIWHAMALTEARTTLAFVNGNQNPGFLQDMKRALGLMWSPIARRSATLISWRARKRANGDI